MNSTPPVIPPSVPAPPASSPRRPSVILKLVCIGVLLILLQIPVGLTHGIVKDRRSYQSQATGEITSSWGGPETLVGPILAVPYFHKARAIHERVVNGQRVNVEETDLCPATAYFLPENLSVDGTVDPETRYRGIYGAVVYTGRFKTTAHFQADFAAARIEADQIDWAHARVVVGVAELRGIRSLGPLHFGADGSVPFESTGLTAEKFHPLAAAVPLAGAGALDVSFELVCQGSDAIHVAPVGKATRIRLQSPWADPSFIGSTLPVTRTVGPNGFDATWESVEFSHSFPKSWANRVTHTDDVMAQVNDAAIGVRFARPVDGYGMVERAEKYATLFFVLIFNAFFLFEMTASVRIHPLQYAMVGAALCLFFLGFLALTEFWSIAWAYGVSAVACTAMISLYSWSFLKTGARTLIVAAGLASNYGYLYFVLQSQDYALVAGTFALFAGLAIAMYCTRRLNWYAVELPGTPNAAAVE
ncbi:MAG TPA: cell envelope integrity protein CreD [Candidatus Didemnitutus sp.]|nr:cell envelope integrity protein CreD [Candidatus Didemnitutus sp.]